MSHNVLRISILAVCSAAIAVVPAAADDLANYFNSPTNPGSNPQVLDYSGNGTTFTDGDLQFQFTGLTITPTCTDVNTGQTVSCLSSQYNPNQVGSLNVTGTLASTGYAGFDLTGEVDVSSYMSNGDTIDVNEDVNLNYTVSTVSGASSISGALLNTAVCISEGNGCINTGTNLPPKFRITENWEQANQIVQVTGLTNADASANFLPNTYSTLNVSKDIFLDSGTCTYCNVGFSDLKQMYSEVPEPRASAAFLAIGLLGLAQLRRRLAAKA